MEFTTIIALIIVLSILLFSVAISLGIDTRIIKIYEAIRDYIQNITVGTTVTAALLITAVLLAVIASM